MQVGVLLRDRLALLGEAHVAAQRAVRQRGDEAVRRAGAAADGAAAAVEEAQPHAGRAPDRGERGLRARRAPTGSPRCRRPCCCRCSRSSPAARGSPPARRVRWRLRLRRVIGWARKRRRMSGARSQILDGLEQRHDRQPADQAVGRSARRGRPRAPAGRPTSRSERSRVMLTISAPRPSGAVRAQLRDQHAVAVEHGVGFRVRRWCRGE